MSYAMEIYLDANATTPVLAQARAAALQAMAEDFGNPSSAHGTGLKARATMAAVRDCARRVLRVPHGHLLFVSGATEGIQTAVLSALTAIRARSDGGGRLVLLGATEHKAVAEAIHHWRAVLNLDLQVLTIPVGSDGRHQLAWLRQHAPEAGLVCTMAANNETGVISDLPGIADALQGSRALWLVDSVQALGKLDLQLAERPIDYATFSGHKLYAPKGVGLLYVRPGAPLTPLLAGGGQEDALRAGTENMPGIAALGAVLQALEDGQVFQPAPVLAGYRMRLVQALRDALPGIVFNAPDALCLPTTLNFSVPGISSKVLLDVFDAAALRLSGGSACSSSKALPSFVLEAMGLPAWRTATAVRMSFGPATEPAMIDAACQRILACGQALRDSCMGDAPPPQLQATPGVTRLSVDGACCYVVADAASRRCVVIDPLPALAASLAQWIRCRQFVLKAILATHDADAMATAARAVCAALPAQRLEMSDADALGWPLRSEHVSLGALMLTRLAPADLDPAAQVLVLRDAQGHRLAFVGTLLAPEAPDGESAAQRDPAARSRALQRLAEDVGMATLLLPARDDDDRWASTLAGECSTAEATLQLTPVAAAALIAASTDAVLVDVREPYEQRLGRRPALGAPLRCQAVPLSALIDALPGWLHLPPSVPLLFFCRSGNRSNTAAAVLRRLGHARAYSLAGGLALWPAAT